jgi:anti-sigma factor RsiW
MNCQRVQNLLSALIDQELESGHKREIRRHLVGCPDCHAEHNGLLQLKECFGNLAKTEPAFNTLARLRMRLADDPGASPFSTAFNLILLRGLSLTGACLLLFLLATAFLYPASAPSSGIATETSITAPASVATADQNFSLDQSVTVYQASLDLP